MQRIETIFFDVGNTLLQTADDEGQTFVRLAAEHGIDLSVDAVQSQIPSMYRLYEDLYSQDESFWQSTKRVREVWLKMYDYLGDLLRIPTKARPDISQKVYEHYFSPQAWRPFDDVTPTLLELKNRGIRMGIISNWESSLSLIINGLGMGDYFVSVVSSADVGLYKPMPEVFELALSQLAAIPEASLHVGDTVSADVEGARSVGIIPVLIDRNGRHQSANCHRIDDLRQLLDLIPV
jgi:putative hydrolase of the HAD superfamily